MSTVLINPPSLTYRKPEEHLGLAYLKSYLLENGYNCNIIDGYASGMNNDEIVDQIIRTKECNIIGLSPSIDSMNNTREIMQVIKEKRKDIKIVLGGHLATFSYGDLLNQGADIIVRGEGEVTLLELVQIIEGGESDLSQVKGIAYKDAYGKVIKTPARELIKNLDLLPFPDRKYTKLVNNQGALIQVSGSRGCYGNCSFCSINSLYRLSNGEVWRGRSPENIVSELKHLKETYGFSVFKFVDDSFLGKGVAGQERGEDIAKRIIDSGLDIKFRISIRADSVEKSLFKLLKQAGLYSVSIGIESGHERALQTFNKGISLNKNIEALKILKDLEIITLMGFIGFDPYTNITECQENLDFLKEMDFVLTDIISKPLFVHAKDPITTSLMNEGILKERNFPNYTYDIKDPKANTLHKLLERWNSFNKDIYYEISDMLTAPRITTKEQEVNLLKLFKRLRIIDLNIYEMLLSAIKLGMEEEELNLLLYNYEQLKIPEIRKIEEDFYHIIGH